jgi:hypothetical protein
MHLPNNNRAESDCFAICSISTGSLLPDETNKMQNDDEDDEQRGQQSPFSTISYIKDHLDEYWMEVPCKGLFSLQLKSNKVLYLQHHPWNDDEIPEWDIVSIIIYSFFILDVF